MNIAINTPLSFCQLGDRANQEDSRYPDTDTAATTDRLFAVCDGMGGHTHGEVASRLVRDEIAKRFTSLKPSKALGERTARRLIGKVADTFLAAASKRDTDMGTTLVMLYLHAGGALVAHVGDSRAYHFRQGNIAFRTTDHSYVGELLKSGAITEQEALTHPMRNVVTSCFSPLRPNRSDMKVGVAQIRDVRPGDYFLLCSDGVTNQIGDDELTALVTDSAMSDKEKMDKLAHICRTSADNNTAILVHIDNVHRLSLLQRIKSYISQ